MGTLLTGHTTTFAKEVMGTGLKDYNSIAFRLNLECRIRGQETAPEFLS